MHRVPALAVLVAGIASAEPARWERFEVVTLPYALEIALADNPGVRAASLEVERAEQTISATRTRYLPVLSLEAQAGQLLAPVKLDFPQGAFGTLPGVGAIPAADTTVRSSTDITLSVSSSLAQPVTQIFAVQMRSGLQIDQFGRDVDAALADLKNRLPEDLVLARTSDQPLQVKESVDLFMTSLWEAVILVVLVSLVGFWEWRSALLMALSIPITLAMTFGMMRVLGIDLQQISIAALIIALGLLVDDPVVAGDAVKRELGAGLPRLVAAWLGPYKLATAIMFATVTNIVAYLPFLMLTGDTGKFLYSLPVVIACSLVASRLVSMTFIPLLAYYLLRPRAEPPIEERRKTGFAARYYRLGNWAIAHRWKVLGASLLFLLLGGVLMSRLKTQFFPKDLQYLSWVDVWLPEDVPLSATGASALEAERAIRDVAEKMGQEHAKGGKPEDVLVSLTTFVGGGGPRFWISASPEQSQLNYAQIILLAKDKHLTSAIVDPVQRAVSARSRGPPSTCASSRAAEASGSPSPSASPARRSAPCDGSPRRRRRSSAPPGAPRASATTGGPTPSPCASSPTRTAPTPPASPTRTWQALPPRRSPGPAWGRCVRARSRSPSWRACGRKSGLASTICGTSTSTRETGSTRSRWGSSRGSTTRSRPSASSAAISSVP
jgi:preprotein translocase subunit SecF